jgi:hypothetical protein
VPIPRIHMTTRGMMRLVLSVAVLLAFWTWGQNYLRAWEARRVVMSIQRDVTRIELQEAQADLEAAGHTDSTIRREGDEATYTSHWTEKLDAWETRDGQRLALIRVTVSGDVGHFSLAPIVVETYGSPLDRPWLDRLLQAYRARGWRYKVIQNEGR